MKKAQMIWNKVVELSKINDMVVPVFEKLVSYGRPTLFVQGDLMREFGGCPFANTEKSLKVERAMELLISKGIAKGGSEFCVRDYNKGFMPVIQFDNY